MNWVRLSCLHYHSAHSSTFHPPPPASCQPPACECLDPMQQAVCGCQCVPQHKPSICTSRGPLVPSPPPPSQKTLHNPFPPPPKPLTPVMLPPTPPTKPTYSQINLLVSVSTPCNRLCAAVRVRVNTGRAICTTKEPRIPPPQHTQYTRHTQNIH